jgi:hypothetical protein
MSKTEQSRIESHSPIRAQRKTVAYSKKTRVVVAEGHHWNCGIRSSVLSLMHTQHTFRDATSFLDVALFLSSYVLHNPSIIPFSLLLRLFSCFSFKVSAVSAVTALCLHETRERTSAARATPLIPTKLTSTLLECLLPNKQVFRHGEEKLPATTVRTGGVRFPSREHLPLRGRESQGHGLIEQMCLWS